MPRTPITGLVVGWRDATGHDDLLLVEGRGDLATAVRVVGHRAELPPDQDGIRPTADELPVGDIDALIVAMRVERLGSGMVAEITCGRCEALADIDFDLVAYAEHRRPRRSRAAAPAAEPGWWRLLRSATTFRLPSAADVLGAGAEATNDDAARAALVAACIRGDVSAPAVRAAERAMETLAPILRSTVPGACPECGAPVDLDLDARALCLAELGFLAGAVLDEVHLLAAAYHWTERDILDLPSSRRSAYAERVRVASGAADPAGVSVG